MQNDWKEIKVNMSTRQGVSRKIQKNYKEKLRLLDTVKLLYFSILATNLKNKILKNTSQNSQKAFEKVFEKMLSITSHHEN